MSLALYIEDLLKTVHDLEEQREALLATMDELLNYYTDPSTSGLNETERRVVASAEEAILFATQESA